MGIDATFLSGLLYTVAVGILNNAGALEVDCTFDVDCTLVVVVVVVTFPLLSADQAGPDNNKVEKAAARLRLRAVKLEKFIDTPGWKTCIPKIVD